MYMIGHGRYFRCTLTVSGLNINNLKLDSETLTARLPHNPQNCAVFTPFDTFDIRSPSNASKI